MIVPPQGLEQVTNRCSLFEPHAVILVSAGRTLFHPTLTLRGISGTISRVDWFLDIGMFLQPIFTEHSLPPTLLVLVSGYVRLRTGPALCTSQVPPSRRWRCNCHAFHLPVPVPCALLLLARSTSCVCNCSCIRLWIYLCLTLTVLCHPAVWGATVLIRVPLAPIRVIFRYCPLRSRSRGGR